MCIEETQPTKERLEQLEMDFGTLRTGVKIAEQTINKGSAKLSNVAQNKIINREKLIQAQNKIDMSLKRKT